MAPVPNYREPRDYGGLAVTGDDDRWILFIIVHRRVRRERGEEKRLANHRISRVGIQPGQHRLYCHGAECVMPQLREMQRKQNPLRSL